ncbi:hypothetical protein [Gordonia hydrophobica]|uniref:Uncharacterized protein n=1 Tax=Gordonia hydrophobica TaxID=40516 RepID=A0ABZ2U2F6_9ACTN|nr:hypothetical protein [Gordonia hydrophobica]MBM7369078.1 hypothetical protein [Gordonia hydrophobica]
MNRRTIAAALLAGGVLASLSTACSATDSAVSAPSSSTGAQPTAPHSTSDTSAQRPARSVPETAVPPADEPTTTQVQQPAATQTPQATTPAPEVTTQPTVVPCDSASAGSFASIAANSSIAYQLVTPVVFDSVQCSGTSARARTQPDGVHQPTGVLFRYSPGTDGGQWIAVAVGSAIDCVDYGSTPADAANLEGCR